MIVHQPLLGHLAIGDAKDVDAGKLDLFAGRGDAGKRALVDATDSPARSYFVTFGSLISNRKIQVAKGGTRRSG